MSSQIVGFNGAILGLWIFASMMGWAVGLTAGVLLTLGADKFAGLNPDRFLAYATLFSVGLATGVAQWKVMTPYLPKPIRWVIVTLTGYLLSLIVISGVSLAKFSAVGLWDDALLLGLIGAAIGSPQWWLLQQHYRGAKGWILVTAAGFLSFLWLVANPAHSQVEFIGVGAILGALAAALPGAVLAWAVRRPVVTVL